jgi:hypothetical protein
MRTVARVGCLAVTAAALAWLIPSAASAALANFTWRGQGSTQSPFWSNSRNWRGGEVPHGSVGKLVFPRLGHGCSITQPSGACYMTANDLSGLSVQAIQIDDAAGYSVGDNAITLGPGGITAAPTVNHCPCGFTFLGFPIVLGAAQTWLIDGGAVQANVGVEGPVTGASHALHLVVKDGAFFSPGNFEVGPLRITGPGGRDPFSNGAILLQPNQATSLNGSDGKAVRIAHLNLASSRGVVGPLTLAGAVIWSAGFTPPGTLTVHGPVSFDSASEMLDYITHAGSAPGRDYWQLRANGNVNLGRAHLVLSVSNSRGFGPDQPCPKLTRGDVDTLISTTGLIRGRFAGIANGTKVPVTCAKHPNPMVRIRYHAHSVTAVVQ